MTIELKINNDTLMAIDKAMRNVYELPASTDMRENIYKSIGYDLADKFSSRCKSQVRKASLFSSKNKIKMSLKFHEAWALQYILIDVLVNVNVGAFESTLLTKIIHFIDERIS